MKRVALHNAIRILLLTSLMIVSGCASFSTVPIHRDAYSNITGQSNGKTKLFGRSRTYRGIPVKLQVQTHVDIWIEEEYVLYRKNGSETWEEKQLPTRLYSVRQEPVMGEQIVITDFKRPASGRLKLGLDFTNDQYFDKIDSELTDTTITDSAALLSTIITKTGIRPLSRPGVSPGIDTSNQIWKTRTVAYRRFDINEPDFEHQLETFVGHHLNNCHHCSLDRLTVPLPLEEIPPLPQEGQFGPGVTPYFDQD